MNEYATLPNMKLCETVFASYMRDRFSVEVPADGRVRKLLFRIMQDVQTRPPADLPPNPDRALKLLNDVTLNIARDVFLKAIPKPDVEHVLSQDPVRNVDVQPLVREQALYGDRPVPMRAPSLMPHATEPKRNEISDVVQTYERVMDERHPVANSPAPMPMQDGPTAFRDDPINGEASSVLLESLQRERDSAFPPRIEPFEDTQTRIPPPDDAATIFRRQLKEAEIMNANTKTATMADVLGDPDNVDNNLAIIQAPPPLKRQVVRYLSINSFDRNWSLDPLRSDYRVWFAGYNESDAQSRYKNVLALSVSRLILPLEISEVPSIININTRSSYINDFSFSHPYVMVSLEGFDDIYDGTNDKVRRGFCAMVFDKAFRTPNGRGYVILHSMQGERKVFYPAPLAMLRSLRINLLKPNGTLLNVSTDDFKVTKLEYEDYNSTRLRVVANKFFDKNDFYIGDLALMREYKSDQLVAGGVDAQFQALNTYINRPEGHEITELGQPNENGFYKTFYIMAPGSMDRQVGRLIVDMGLVNALREFNLQQQQMLTSTGQTYDDVINGALCNASLQNNLMFTVWQEVSDMPRSRAIAPM